MARAFSYAEVPRAQLHAALVYASTPVWKRQQLPPWQELDEGAVDAAFHGRDLRDGQSGKADAAGGPVRLEPSVSRRPSAAPAP
jgi:hypothetical protein